MIALALAASVALGAAPAPLEVPGFGRVAVHAPGGAPSRVVLFLSGAGGLDPATDAVAAALAGRGALVLGIDTPAYLGRHAQPSARGSRCLYPAGDLESLAQDVEKRLGLPAYLHPALVGHSRGAQVVWAALAQAPEGTFAAGVAVAPCPGLPLGVKLCAGVGPRPRATPGGDLPADDAPPSAPLAVVAGEKDATCPAAPAEAFARAKRAAYAVVPGAAHALTPPGPWVEAIAAALEGTEVQPQAPVPAPPEVKDLPVHEVPATKPGRRLAVLLTGDGGWVSMDRSVAATLAESGVSVVGLDSLKYFWKRRTPEETARDVARIIAHYRAAWDRPEVLLVGYSRGADIVPFLPPRMPEPVRGSIRLVAMLGAETYADFEVHVVDLFASFRRSSATSTEVAVRALGATPVLCIRGADETDTVCPRVASLPNVREVVLPGGHHFDRDYPKLARLILDAAD